VVGGERRSLSESCNFRQEEAPEKRSGRRRPLAGSLFKSYSKKETSSRWGRGGKAKMLGRGELQKRKDGSGPFNECGEEEKKTHIEMRGRKGGGRNIFAPEGEATASIS